MRIIVSCQWDKTLAENQVVVATAQVLLNLLEKGNNYLSFSRINYLILDECHAAVKSHPFNKVMAKYLAEDQTKRPKVFGMTVSGRIDRHKYLNGASHPMTPFSPVCFHQATPSPQSIQNLGCPVYLCTDQETRNHAAVGQLSIIPYDDKVRPTHPVLDTLIHSIKDHIIQLPGINLKADAVPSTYETHGLWFALR